MRQYKNNIIRGTFILMLSGLLTRFLGFYYRIFLSSRIGAEGVGLYQMIFPIYGLCISLAVSGVQMAISRFVSACEKNSLKTLAAGLLISVPISLICSALLFFGSDAISVLYLNEARCSTLLKLSAIALPMSVVHNCINGYFIGKKNATVPGLTQFMEQFARIATMWIIFHIAGDTVSDSISSLAAIAVLGLIVGEFSSMLVSIIATIFDKPSIKCFCISSQEKNSQPFADMFKIKKLIRPLALMSFPLTMTNLVLGIVHSLEATAIPFFLHKYGLTYTNAISIYGILTGMSLPFIMFPTTVTGAVSRMLLPTISAAQAEKNNHRITSLSLKTLKYSVALGLFCTCFFIVAGDSIGNIVYDNEMSGSFITILAWLCPFMFVSGTLGSILHGLGLTKTTFYQNMISSCLRLCFVIFIVPMHGIKGYMWGILASECLCALMHTISVIRYLNSNAV